MVFRGSNNLHLGNMVVPNEYVNKCMHYLQARDVVYIRCAGIFTLWFWTLIWYFGISVYHKICHVVVFCFRSGAVKKNIK